jgi:hypothetical protein
VTAGPRPPRRAAWTPAASLILLVVLLMAGCARPVRARPELSEGKHHRTISILPPLVTISKSRMSGGEGLVAESLMMEDRILALLSSELTGKGYQTSDTLTLEKLDQAPELRAAVTDLQARHDELLPVISRDPRGVAKGRFSLGGDVPAVGGAAGTDLLAFARAQGLVVSGGRKTFEGILSLGQRVPRNWLAIRITVVDARDGRVMATVNGFAFGGFLKQPDEVVGRALHKAFRKFPAPSPASASAR